MWGVAEKIAVEGQRVMEKMGFQFDAPNEVRKVAEMTANNRSSMLQDIEKGKRTEIDYINGAIVKKGEELGVKCTVNEVLWRLVKGVEHGHH